MKIAFFIPNATFDLPGTPEVGGIETFSFTIGEALQRLGHEVVLYGGRPKTGRRHRETTLPLHLFDYVETRSIPDLGTRFQRLVQRLHFGWTSRGVWMDEKPDMAILAKPFDWPVAAWWKRRQPGLKVVMGFHGTDFFPGDTLFWKAVDRSFAVSAPVADQAERRVGVRPPVISNPVDTRFYDPALADVPEQSVALRICASGRLVGWKGFARLLEAVALLRRDGMEVECRLAGDGPERVRLERQAEEMGIRSCVHFEGLLGREALRLMLASGDVYVAPSVGPEAFSIAALEAASMGLPLVLSDQIGLASVLSGEDFSSYPHGSAADLAARLGAAAAARSAASFERRRARHERVAGRFSPESCAGKILQLFGD